MVIPEQEQAAQMRTMVWLEERSHRGRWVDVMAQDNPPVLAKDQRDYQHWCHPDATLPTMRGCYSVHPAVPLGLRITAWGGFHPADRGSYDRMTRWEGWSAGGYPALWEPRVLGLS